MNAAVEALPLCKLLPDVVDVVVFFFSCGLTVVHVLRDCGADALDARSL